MPNRYEDKASRPKHVVTQPRIEIPATNECRDRDDNAMDEPVPNWTE